jgi:DNA replication and repair protein RecF
MFLSRLELTHFRNIKSLKLDLPEKAVIFFGENAQGKTNLLEATYLLSTTKSFRADKDSQMVQVGQNFTRVWGKADSLEVEILVKLLKPNLLSPGYVSNPAIEQITPDEDSHVPGGNYPTQKEIKVNNTSKRALEALGEIKAILFSPEDINILTGPPADRRRFLDVLISTVDRKYLFNLAQYQKTLKSRNRVLWWLKEGRSENLEVWDEQIISLGAALWKRRFEVVDQLNELLGPISLQLQGQALKINYQPKLSLEKGAKRFNLEALRAKFREGLDLHRREDIKRSTTATGPHRDDFSVFRLTLTGEGRETVSGVGELANLAVYGSRGEQRAAVLALKMAELSFQEKESGEKPILLLDDVLSEFDVIHRKHLLDLVGNQQTLLTTTSLDLIDPQVRQKAAVFRVERGEVSKE